MDTAAFEGRLRTRAGSRVVCCPFHRQDTTKRARTGPRPGYDSIDTLGQFQNPGRAAIFRSVSSFQVVPVDVTDAATRLSSISGAVRDVHGRLGACSGAAAGTPAEGAVSGLLGRWRSVLPDFAGSAESLTLAVGAAAQDYGTTDADVAAAYPSEGGAK